MLSHQSPSLASSSTAQATVIVHMTLMSARQHNMHMHTHTYTLTNMSVSIHFAHGYHINTFYEEVS